MTLDDIPAGTAVPLDAADVALALDLQRQHRLLTNDSLHLAAALRANLPALATNDHCFDQVNTMTIYKPDDVV
jgi:predicted nucleic acid-binding protein